MHPKATRFPKNCNLRRRKRIPCLRRVSRNRHIQRRVTRTGVRTKGYDQITQKRQICLDMLIGDRNQRSTGNLKARGLRKGRENIAVIHHGAQHLQHGSSNDVRFKTVVPPRSPPPATSPNCVKMRSDSEAEAWPESTRNFLRVGRAVASSGLMRFFIVAALQA